MNEIIIKEHTIIEDLLKNKDLTVIDLGACKGEFIYEIEQKFSIKKAILVEPNPTNFSFLKQKENFILINKAAFSRKSETLQFREDIDSPYNGSLLFDYFGNYKIHNIESITLKELLTIINEDEVDLLKIDIEGSEYDLLLNADNEDLMRFRQITVEFHDFVCKSLKNKNDLIESKFINMGFKVIKKKTDYKEGSDYYDTLFYK